MGCLVVMAMLGLMLVSLQASGQVAVGQLGIEQGAIGHVSEEALANPQASFAGNAFAGNVAACSQGEKLQIPKAVVKRARLKAQLMNVLRQSIFDDAKGIVNLARERQIKDLVSKLSKEKAE